MVIFAAGVVYLALAASFYLYLTRTATNVSMPMRRRSHKWQRPRHLRGVNLLRRLRPLLALRLPKRARKN